jgi:hypothetical protein
MREMKVYGRDLVRPTGAFTMTKHCMGKLQLVCHACFLCLCLPTSARTVRECSVNVY